MIKWQKLSAALAPNAEGEWDLATLREALEEASAAGLPPLPEAQATLLRAEEAAKERVVRQKMKREAEKNLNAAMPSMFGHLPHHLTLTLTPALTSTLTLTLTLPLTSPSPSPSP